MTHRLHALRPTLLAWLCTWLGAAAVVGYAIAGRPELVLILVSLAVAVGTAIRFPAAVVTGVVLVGAFAGSLRAFTDEEFPARNLTQLLMVAVVIAAIASHLLVERRRTASIFSGVALLAVYLGVTVVQIPFAESTTVGLQAFRAAWLPMLLLLAVGYAAWRPKACAAMATGVLAVALLVGAYAVLRLVIGPSEAERQLAEASIYNILNENLALVGSFASRQELSSWTAVAIPFCMAFALMAPRRRRWVPAGATVLCLVALVGSQTRTSLVAAAGGLLLVAALSVPSRATGSLQLGRAAAILTGLVVIGGLGFALILGGSEGAVQRYSSIVDPGEDRTFEVRLDKWEATTDAIERDPLGLGIGSVGSTQENFGRFVQVSSFEIDNTYLEVAYQQGIGPLLLFGAALLALLYAVSRSALGSGTLGEATIAAGAAGALASWMVLLTTLSQLESSATTLLWVVLGLAVAQSAERAPAEGPTAPASLS